MKPFLLMLGAVLLALSVALATTYVVKQGDTLSSIARQFNVSVSDLRRANNLTSDALRAGQTLQIPAPSSSTPPNTPPASTETSSSGAQALLTVKGETPGVSVTHRVSCIPGDPVLVRVKGVLAGAPIVTWGTESLVMTQDRDDWVGVGRELLGTKPKIIALNVNLGAEVIPSTIKLLPDPKLVQNVFMSGSVLSTLTDANRKREYAVLNAAYAKSLTTPKAWTKAFSYPAPPRTISPFGQARLYQKGGDLNFHYGEDMAGKVGDPVRATNDGTVEIAAQYAIRGGLIGINHGAGLVSLYFHQSAILVKVGQRVTRGQIIGRIGATGFVTGPHLHWEMRVRGEATDPKQWANRIFPL
jgi:murein DD-endopeptidase MepM/ murein hydrolase activator NlpD